MPLFFLPQELRFVVFSELTVADRAALKGTCKSFRDDINALNDREIERIYINIKEIGLKALVDIKDPNQRRLVYRSRVNQLIDYITHCTPLTTNRPQYIATTLLLNMFQVLNPRHQFTFNSDTICHVPFQRPQLFAYLNTMLPSSHQITANGLDLSTFENVDEEMVLAWYETVKSGNENEELYGQLIKGIRELRIDCETRINKQPLVCIATQYAKGELFEELLAAGAYVNDSAPPISPTPLVLATIQYASSNVKKTQMDTYLEIITNLLQREEVNVNALVKEGLTIFQLLVSYPQRREMKYFFDKGCLLKVIMLFLEFRANDIRDLPACFNQPTFESYNGGMTLVEHFLETKDWKMIDMLINSGFLDLAVDSNKNTLLHRLVKHAIYFDNFTHDFENSRNPYGPQKPPENYPQRRLIALHLIEQLLAKGADITLLNRKEQSITT